MSTAQTLPLNAHPRQPFAMIEPSLLKALIDGPSRAERAQAAVVLAAQTGETIPGRRELAERFNLPSANEGRKAYNKGLERVEKTCDVRFDAKERRRMARAVLPPLLTRRRAQRSPTLRAHRAAVQQKKSGSDQAVGRQTAAQRPSSFLPKGTQPRADENSLPSVATSRATKLSRSYVRYKVRALEESSKRANSKASWLKHARPLKIQGNLEQAARVLDGAMFHHPVLALTIASEAMRWLHRVNQIRPWERLKRWDCAPALGQHLKIWLREQPAELVGRVALKRRRKPDPPPLSLDGFKPPSWDELKKIMERKRDAQR